MTVRLRVVEDEDIDLFFDHRTTGAKTPVPDEGLEIAWVRNAL